MKTREEVDALKEEYLNEGVWEIEDTEGFSDYYWELKCFRLLREQQTTKETKTEAIRSAEYLQTSMPVAKNIKRLWIEIDKLDDRVTYLENGEHNEY